MSTTAPGRQRGCSDSPDAENKVIDSDNIPDGWMGLDIGPKTRKELFKKTIVEAKTVIWNGPMGVFEMPAFAEGTRAVAAACAECKGTTIIGGELCLRGQKARLCQADDAHLHRRRRIPRVPRARFSPASAVLNDK